MKKNLLIPVVIVLSSLTGFAQTTPVTTPATTPATPATSTWDARQNPTVAAILNKYESAPAVTKPAQTASDIFPAVGLFEMSSPAAASVHINQDAANKGIIQIEGLPEGTLKAYLRRSPSTYSIPAQKNADGKSIPEGTLIYDPAQNLLQICLGKAFQDADPALVFQETQTVTVEEKTIPKTKHGRTASPKKPAAPVSVLYKGSKVPATKETAAM